MKKGITMQLLVSLVLKLVIFVAAVVGVILSAYAGRNSFMGGRSVFMFFTIQSNIAIAVIALVGGIMLLRQIALNRILQVIVFVGTVSITLTGVVFCFVLAPTMGGAAWNPQNILTHVIVPVVSVIDFFWIGIRYHYKKIDDVWVIVPPIAYAVYAGIGYVKGWEFGPGIHYPYFFLNWGSKAGAFGFADELPYMGTAWWILALFIFLLLVGWVYLKILDVRNKICAC